MTDAPKHRDLGLLFLRLGIGAMFVAHGIPKLMGGPAKWALVGHAIGNFGIHFAPTFWGFMAAFAEAGGGACLALGLFFQPALVLLVITMSVAVTQHLVNHDSFVQASHALEAAILFASLLLIGPGRYRVRIGS